MPIPVIRKFDSEPEIVSSTLKKLPVVKKEISKYAKGTGYGTVNDGMFTVMKSDDADGFFMSMKDGASNNYFEYTEKEGRINKSFHINKRRLTEEVSENDDIKTLRLKYKTGKEVLVIKNKQDGSTYEIITDKRQHSLNESLSNWLMKHILGTETVETNMQKTVLYKDKFGKVIAKAIDGEMVFVNKDIGISPALKFKMQDDSDFRSLVVSSDVTKNTNSFYEE